VTEHRGEVSELQRLRETQIIYTYHQVSFASELTSKPQSLRVERKHRNMQSSTTTAIHHATLVRPRWTGVAMSNHSGLCCSNRWWRWHLSRRAVHHHNHHQSGCLFPAAQLPAAQTTVSKHWSRRLYFYIWLMYPASG